MKPEEFQKKIAELEQQIADIKKQSGFFELHEHTGFDANTLKDLISVPVSFASTVYTNANIGGSRTIQFEFTATASFTMANPTNCVNGKKIIYKIKQDGTGSRVVTWGSNFRATATGTLPVLSTTAAYVDYVGFVYDAVTGKWNCLAEKIGFAT